MNSCEYQLICEYRLTCFTSAIYLYDTCTSLSTVVAEKLSELTIKPLYLKDSDIKCKDKGLITDFDLMESITAVVGIPYIVFGKIETCGVFT